MQWLIHTATDNKYGVYREKRKLLWDTVENSAQMDGKTKKRIFSQRHNFAHCCILEDSADLPKMLYLTFWERTSNRICISKITELGILLKIQL